MKKLFLVPVLFMWSLSVSGALVDRTVAVVDKEVILQSDVDAILAQRSLGGQSFNDVLSSLIEKAVLESACQKLGISPSEQEIDQQLRDIKKQNRLDDEGLLSALQKNGMTLPAFRSQISFAFCRTRIVQKEIRANISKDDVRRAYDQTYGSDANANLHLRHFFIKPKSGNLKDMALAKQLASQMSVNLLKGQKWEEVIKQNQKKGPAVTSENLETVSKGDLLPAVANLVFSDSTEKFRGPVETDDGFHIFEVLGKVNGPKIPLVDVEKDLHKQLFEKEVERLLKQYIEQARASTSVDIIGLD